MLLKNTFALVGLALYAESLIAQPAAEPGVSEHETREINLDGSTKKTTSLPPLNEPFAMADPHTGLPISADTIIKLPNGTEIKAGEYYSLLNGYQAKLNADGLSLKSIGKDLGAVSEIVVNLQSLEAKGEEAKKATQDKDKSIMGKLPTPAELKADLANAASDGIKDELAALYKKAIKAGVPLPLINSRPPVQAIVLKPYDELHSLVQKEWTLNMVDNDTIGVAGKASISAGINLSKIEGTVDTNIVATMLKKEKQLLDAKAYAVRSLTSESKATILFSVIGKTIYTHEWLDKHISISAPDADAPRRQSIRASQDYRFAVGPVPMKATIGVAGILGYDWTIGLVGNRGAATIIGFAEADAFATCEATVEIASVGVGGKLILVNETLELSADMGLEFDKTSGTPILNTGVKATNLLTMLSGELFAYVRAYVPTLSIPPFDLKEWRLTLFNWEGMTLGGNNGPKVLWSFNKLVDKNGYRLTGSPLKEDYDDVNADEELGKSMAEAVTMLNASENNIEPSINESLGFLQIVRDKLKGIIDTMGH